MPAHRARRALSAALLAQLASPPCAAVQLEAMVQLEAQASVTMPEGPVRPADAARSAMAPASVSSSRAAGAGSATSAPTAARRGERARRETANWDAHRFQALHSNSTSKQAPALSSLLLLASSGAADAAARRAAANASSRPAHSVRSRAGAVDSVSEPGESTLVAWWAQWAAGPPWRGCLGGLLVVAALAIAAPAACCAHRLKTDAAAAEAATPPAASLRPAAKAKAPKTVHAEPRLAQCGTSFVVPAASLATPAQGCGATTLDFDVPVWPAVWPLRASLWRPDGSSPWKLLQVTVDIIAAAGLPPLFSAKHFGNPDPSKDGEPPSPAIVITEGGGTVAASILPSHGGRCVICREGQVDWELRVDGRGAPGDCPSVRVQRNGQDIALSTAVDAGGRAGAGVAGRALQLDVQPEAHSTDAPLLLTCMLAAVVFQP